MRALQRECDATKGAQGGNTCPLASQKGCERPASSRCVPSNESVMPRRVRKEEMRALQRECDAAKGAQGGNTCPLAR